MKKPYKVLVLEDEDEFAEPLRVALRNDPDFQLIGLTSRATEALQLLKAHIPNFFVVDLQIDEGDGHEVLDEVRKLTLPITPYILVTTTFANKKNKAVLCHDLADYVLDKNNESYSADRVLAHFRIVAERLSKTAKTLPPVSEADKEQTLRTRITRELEQYYMSASGRGKEYLVELIYLAFILPPHEDIQIRKLYAEVGKVFRKESAAVDVSIRRLLDAAFLKTHPDDLVRLYPYYIDIGRGAPRNKEFVTFIVDKIKKENIV